MEPRKTKRKPTKKQQDAEALQGMAKIGQHIKEGMRQVYHAPCGVLDEKMRIGTLVGIYALTETMAAILYNQVLAEVGADGMDSLEEFLGRSDSKLWDLVLKLVDHGHTAPQPVHPPQFLQRPADA